MINDEQKEAAREYAKRFQKKTGMVVTGIKISQTAITSDGKNSIIKEHWAEHYCDICGDCDTEPIACTPMANCLNISLANEQKIKR